MKFEKRQHFESEQQKLKICMFLDYNFWAFATTIRCDYS